MVHKIIGLQKKDFLKIFSSKYDLLVRLGLILLNTVTERLYTVVSSTYSKSQFLDQEKELKVLYYRHFPELHQLISLRARRVVPLVL